MASGLIQAPEDGTMQPLENGRKQRTAYTPERDIVIVSPGEEPILLKSYLHKKGKRFRGWHHRYFEIQGMHMYYYKNASKADCLGEIDLSLCVHCAPANEATFGAPFEICTTLRTHVMSARSMEERAQWIDAIQTQMKAGPSNSKVPNREVNGNDAFKPKQRWKSFRSAFSIYQRRHRKSSDRKLSEGSTTPNTTPNKRRSIFDHFRHRNSRHTQSESSNEPHSNRPMSMIDNTLTLNTLEVLLDANPSHSLPASPLTKRSNPLHFCPSDELTFENPTFVDPIMTLPANLTALSMTVPSEDFVDPGMDFEYISTPVPLAEALVAASDSGEDGEPSLNMLTDAISDREPASIVIANVDKEQTTSKEQIENDELESTVISEPVGTSKAIDEAKCDIKYSAWEAIREALDKDSDNKWSDVLPSSYDVLPKEDQFWLNASSGVEGLRAFLDMPD